MCGRCGLLRALLEAGGPHSLREGLLWGLLPAVDEKRTERKAERADLHVGRKRETLKVGEHRPPSHFNQLALDLLSKKLSTSRLNNSSSEPMNRPGTSSTSPSVSGLIILHRSTSSTTTKSRSCSWHWWSFQRSISYLCSSSTEHCPRLSCTRPSEPPHNTKFGSSTRTRQLCPVADTRFSFRRRESPTTAAISVTAVSPTITPSTPSATPTSHKRASESLPSAEHDT